MERILPKPITFDWDKGNVGKNWIKHGVTDQESEEPFFDPRRKIFKDQIHSGREERFAVIGKTKQERLLITTFTVRQSRIRVISSRDVNKKEKPLYEKAT